MSAAQRADWAWPQELGHYKSNAPCLTGGDFWGQEVGDPKGPLILEGHTQEDVLEYSLHALNPIEWGPQT